CRSKAWLFSELCAELTDEQAQVVCDRLLPQAGRLTTRELAARIKKLAIALDPEWAARRYATAVRDRDVIGYLDEGGTATVTGRRLPADQAAAACARIEELAKAAKRAGHPLRADIYIGLLDGRWAHATREDIIADLLVQTTPEDTAQNPTREVTSYDKPPTGASADGDTAADGAVGPVAASPVTDDAPPTVDHGDSGSGAKQPTAGRRVGVELRVGLCTLLGRDRHPAEIPGWGPVTAETACVVATAQRAGEWRYALTDPEGQLILAGITRRRPATASDGEPDACPPCRGGIVELHLPATMLTELASDPEACGDWAAVITDLAAQYAIYHDQHTQGAGCGPRQDPGARFAWAALRRHVQIRDRFCVYPGCRCSAQQADLDHTLDHRLGGMTTEANSGPLCRHDHLLKHEGGWRLRQPEPVHFVWASYLTPACPAESVRTDLFSERNKPWGPADTDSPRPSIDTK
ncbi:MAG: HNH endonuclease signature motif containing protein, partial [Actinomycetes bacterium]